MDCRDVRLHLLDHQQGRLTPTLDADVAAHLERCGDCARVDAAEHALTDVLEHRLPQHPASLALKRRLAAQWPTATPVRRPSWATRARWLTPALAAAAVLFVATPVLYRQMVVVPRERVATLTAEAVNDHVRMLSSPRPLEIESGGIHQVKPWFAGKLDFAPVVGFEGDDEFPLRGGALAYFIDRKAAVLQYARRLHPISLLVFRADGLAWPAGGERIGDIDARVTTARGFSVILWRRDELGYALVSDVDLGELRRLAERLIAAR